MTWAKAALVSLPWAVLQFALDYWLIKAMTGGPAAMTVVWLGTGLQFVGGIFIARTIFKEKINAHRK